MPQLVGIMGTQIVVQAEFCNGIYPGLVWALAIVGVAGFMQGKQNFLHQVIHLIGEAEALCQKRPEESRGLLKYFSVSALVSVEGLPH